MSSSLGLEGIHSQYYRIVFEFSNFRNCPVCDVSCRMLRCLACSNSVFVCLCVRQAVDSHVTDGELSESSPASPTDPPRTPANSTASECPLLRVTGISIWFLFILSIYLYVICLLVGMAVCMM